MDEAALADALKESDTREKVRYKRLEFAAPKPAFAFVSAGALGECAVA
jgi:hypothetical protein